MLAAVNFGGTTQNGQDSTVRGTGWERMRHAYGRVGWISACRLSTDQLVNQPHQA